MNIVGKKYVYFGISLVVLIPGLISLFLFGFKPGIDFSGGSRLEYQVFGPPSIVRKTGDLSEPLQKTIKKQGVAIASFQKFSNNIYSIRTKPLDQKTYQKVHNSVQKEFNILRENSFETIGPTIGKETTENAFKSVLVASLLIILYIAWSFRSVPKPASSWRFGVCAVIALIHDVLVLIGVFSILGHFYKVEVDSLFVTAVLTVIGFSVHDTIVVFDRIRENLRRLPGSQFASVVNISILETFTRSLNTSLTVFLVLLTLLLFGGESIRWFVVALLVGIISGTYSSIFNAVPLLVWWHEWSIRKQK